ncbi:MAG: hypothetical protein ISQ03_04470 [Pseudomonadales bacterium]|nr:hypothetical protein [Pseudomonadales bacterium]
MLKHLCSLLSVPTPWVALAGALLAANADGTPLPAHPPAGLRLSFSLGCDFEKRWWEAVLYPDQPTTLTVRWFAPTLFSDEPQQRPRTLTAAEGQALYDNARALLDTVSLAWDADPAAPPGPWLGHRTFSLSAQRLDERLGRVDRLDYSLDLHPGRSLPPLLATLGAALQAQDRRLDLELDCR